MYLCTGCMALWSRNASEIQHGDISNAKLHTGVAQKARYKNTMLFLCWSTAYDAATLDQQRWPNNTAPTTLDQQRWPNNTAPTTLDQQRWTNNAGQQRWTNNTGPTTLDQQHWTNSIMRHCIVFIWKCLRLVQTYSDEFCDWQSKAYGVGNRAWVVSSGCREQGVGCKTINPFSVIGNKMSV